MTFVWNWGVSEGIQVLPGHLPCSPSLHPSDTSHDPPLAAQPLREDGSKHPKELCAFNLHLPLNSNACFSVVLPFQRITYRGFFFQPCGGALSERINPNSVAKSQWHLPCLKRPYFEEWLLILFHISDHSFDAAFHWSWWATLSHVHGFLTRQFTRKERGVLPSGTHPAPDHGNRRCSSEYIIM